MAQAAFCFLANRTHCLTCSMWTLRRRVNCSSALNGTFFLTSARRTLTTICLPPVWSSNCRSTTSSTPLPLQCMSSRLLACQQNYLIDTKCYSKAKSKKGGSKIPKPRAPLDDNEMTPILDVAVIRVQIAEVIAQLREEFNTTVSLRSGVGLEDIKVEIEDESFPIKELATITRSGNNVIRLDFSSVPEATKPAYEAVHNSGMDVNPQQEGTMIYLTLPKITRQHRENLAKNAKTCAILAKAKLNKILSLCNRMISDKKQEAGVQLDLANKTAENVKYIFALASEEVDKLVEAKTKELLE